MTTTDCFKCENAGNYLCSICTRTLNDFFSPKIRTNGDKIRSMTDEELAHLIGEYVTCENCLAHSDACEMEYEPADVPTCEQIWLSWLKEDTE